MADRYCKQTFLGQECTYGDDRHLTNLFLEHGYKVTIALKAIAFTHTPSSLKQWIRQQDRWSKSFYRESWYFLTKVPHKNPWAVFFSLCSFALPIVLALSVGWVVVNLVWTGILHFLIAVFVVATIRGIFGYAMTKNPQFFLAPVYGFLHFGLVTWIRFGALFRLKTQGWGTR